MTRMRRPTAWLLLVCLLPGCAMKHPMKVAMQGDLDASASVKVDNNVRQVCARALPGEPACGPRLALIDVDGLLVNRNLTGMASMGENPVALLREKLQKAERDPCVMAVVLRINSPGGGVTACDIMRWEVEQFRIRSGKPVVACLMDVGAGGAYYIATAADAIVAHPTTITGGVGVILNLYDLEEMMAQQNIFENAIRSGDKIDMGSPVRSMSDQEAELLEGIAAEFHQRFKQAVWQSRPQVRRVSPPGEQIPRPERDARALTEAIEEAAEDEVQRAVADAIGENADVDIDLNDDDQSAGRGDLLDGRVFTGIEAHRLGMVDQLGYLEDATRTAESLAGVVGAKTIVYRRDNDRAITPYDITPNIPGGSLMGISLPGLDRALLPTFLYLWQPEPAYEKTSGP